MADLILNRKFICTNGANNNNKFWKISAYNDGIVETSYGRVGDSGATTRKNFGNEARALKEAEKLIKKKLRGKSGGTDSAYQEIEIIGESTNIKSVKSLGKNVFKKISNNDPVVENLIELLDKQNIHNITSNTDIKYDSTTGLFSTPLGVVGQSNIDKARDILSQIQQYVGSVKSDGDKLAEQFMMLIPQDIGRSRPTLNNICSTPSKFDKLVSVLDSLQASLDILKSSDNKEDPEEEIDFGVTVSQMLDQDIFNKIKSFYNSTRQKQHSCYNLEVDKVWSVFHKGMSDAFDRITVGNIQDLWHGTRVGNVLSILSKGLVIPPKSASHCTGRMFGHGLYFSDQSTKSLNYAYGYWDGGKRDNHCFMFLFDVAMGKSYTPKSSSEKLPKTGYDSTFAKANVSGVHNNEMIIYNINQCRPKYLVEFKG